LEDANFLKKNVTKFFSALRHLPFECNILTIASPNLTIPGPLKTRHSELSRYIKFEENRA